MKKPSQKTHAILDVPPSNRRRLQRDERPAPDRQALRMPRVAASVTPADPDLIQPVSIPSPTLAAAARLAGVRTKLAWRVLVRDASTALGEYVRRRAQTAADPALPARRNVVRKLHSNIERALAAIGGLGPALEGDLAIQLSQDLSPAPDQQRRGLEELHATAIGMQRLDNALTKIRQAYFPNGRLPRGPLQDADVYLLVRELARLWERLSGKPMAHNPYEGTRYDGAPQTPGGKFVLALVRVVEPTMPPSRIAGLIRQFKRNRERELLRPHRAI